MARAKTIIKNTANTISLVGELNLNQSASIIKKADKIITFDTGLMHIASAYRKKIISIWGNTIPEFGMYPYQPKTEKNYSIHQVQLDCRPCSKIGYDACPKKHFHCMTLHKNEDLLNEINRPSKS